MQPLESWLIKLVQEKGTPHFLLDVAIIRRQIGTLNRLLPEVGFFYSTKTNSHPALIDTCHQAGWHFDAATLGEINFLIKRGVLPSNILFTHPIKTREEINQAHELGITQFTCDSLEELTKLQSIAPGTDYFVRITPPISSSVYDYRQRFGANEEEVTKIFDYAIKHHINLVGLSFHVGTQSMSVEPWTKALQASRKVIDTYYHQIPSLRKVNVGSGFPVDYGFGHPPSIESIATTLKKEFAQFPSGVSFIAEPGRIIAAPAQSLIVTIVDRVKRGTKEWLFTDSTTYSGLIERIESGGSFSYPVSSPVFQKPFAVFQIAGKTLDPDDVIAADVELSNSLQAGDILCVNLCGAYTLEFFTTYHLLPTPLVTVYDSEDSTKASKALSNA